VKFITYLHLMPRLRMSGAIPLTPMYATMTCTGTTFFYFYMRRNTEPKQVTLPMQAGH
jgi:hypothetical protein